MLGQAGAWQLAIHREPRCRSIVGVKVDLTWLSTRPAEPCGDHLRFNNFDPRIVGVLPEHQLRRAW